MSTYGQFCPIAKAMELLDERWTLLVVSELLRGSVHFNDLRRGLPKMSPALLSKRLKSLTRAGVVERIETDGRSSYALTPCGQELAGVVGGQEKPVLDDERPDVRVLLDLGGGVTRHHLQQPERAPGDHADRHERAEHQQAGADGARRAVRAGSGRGRHQTPR